MKIEDKEMDMWYSVEEYVEQQLLVGGIAGIAVTQSLIAEFCGWLAKKAIERGVITPEEFVSYFDEGGRLTVISDEEEAKVMATWPKD